MISLVNNIKPRMKSTVEKQEFLNLRKAFF
jgi:hypothetical protein